MLDQSHYEPLLEPELHLHPVKVKKHRFLSVTTNKP